MKRNECFGRPGLRKRGPRPVPWPPMRTEAEMRDSVFTMPGYKPPPSRWNARLRSLGGWMMGSRFGFLRSLGGRLLRKGTFF